MITERIRNLPAPVRLLLGILLGALGSRIMQEVFEDQADTLDQQNTELAKLEEVISTRQLHLEHLNGIIRQRLDQADVVDAELVDDHASSEGEEQDTVPVQALPQVTR
jgi:hypothetical protein